MRIMKSDPSHCSRGFTLIEVLVALLVLSVGLLGTAAMQLQSLQGAHAAYQRSIASLAAQDAQERLWAKLAEDGSCPDWSEANDLGDTDTNWDIFWDTYLPGFTSSASVEQPDTDVCRFDISIEWRDSRFGGDGAVDFEYSVRLPGNT